MASYTPAVSCHKTTSGTTADTITLTEGFRSIEVVNRGSTAIYCTFGKDAPTPVAEADGTTFIPAGGVVTLDGNSRGGFVVKVVGSDSAYSVQGVDE